MAQTFNGRRWHYVSDAYAVGSHAPVHAHTISRTDLTEVEPGDPRHGNTWCGTALVAGWEEVPDSRYRNGMRRKVVLTGPVMNMDQTRVMDAAPVFVEHRVDENL